MTLTSGARIFAGASQPMPASSSQLLVAVEGARAIVKVCGRASFTCSAGFKSLVYDLRARGYRSFMLDLTECVIMDSTFLGILARFAQRLSEGGPNAGSLVLLNPSVRILDLLDNLGVAPLFNVERGMDPLARHCEQVAPPATGDEKIAAARAALEAHETLMELNPANVPKFKDVTRFMAEDLQKLERRPLPGA